MLVVGAGSSGSQIAAELMKTERKIFLSVGAHDRPPRRYRNRDFCWWLGVLNLWDAEANRHQLIQQLRYQALMVVQPLIFAILQLKD